MTSHTFKLVFKLDLYCDLHASSLMRRKFNRYIHSLTRCVIPNSNYRKLRSRLLYLDPRPFPSTFDESLLSHSSTNGESRCCQRQRVLIVTDIDISCDGLSSENEVSSDTQSRQNWYHSVGT